MSLGEAPPTEPGKPRPSAPPLRPRPISFSTTPLSPARFSPALPPFALRVSSLWCVPTSSCPLGNSLSSDPISRSLCSSPGRRDCSESPELTQGLQTSSSGRPGPPTSQGSLVASGCDPGSASASSWRRSGKVAAPAESSPGTRSGVSGLGPGAVEAA